jgi:hypothetical protein
MIETVEIITLKRALEIAGDIVQLSKKVGPRAERLLAMLRGDAAIENWVFLRALDYISEAQAQPHKVQAHDFHPGTDTVH